MYILRDPPVLFAGLNTAVKACASEVVSQLIPEAVDHLIEASEDVLKGPRYHGKLLVIKEGAIKCASAGVVVLCYEAGDLLGFEFGLSEKYGLKFSTDFAVKVDLYDVGELRAQLGSKPALFETWQRLVGLELTLHKILLGSVAYPEDNVIPQVHNFSAGDCIIKQGSRGSLIYTMVEGSADVLVDQQHVGSIGPNEIFGALAALTDSDRTASVIANSACLVLSLDKANFVQLLRERPQTVAKMVEDLGRVIVSLNKHVVGSAARVMA